MFPDENIPDQLSSEAFAEFKAAYSQEFPNDKISDDELHARALGVLRVFDIITREQSADFEQKPEIGMIVPMDPAIIFQKQNIPFEAEPNVAVPQVSLSKDGLILSFAAKNRLEANILFTEPLMYRVGDPNDEGFYGFGFDPKYKNTSIYSRKRFPNLDFGDFYLVKGVDWKKDLLGEGTQVVDQNYAEKEGFSHFVFFMKDGTFECAAKSYIVK